MMRIFYLLLACTNKRHESGIGLPHSKTLRHVAARESALAPKAFGGVRQPYAAFWCIAKLCSLALVLPAVALLASGCRTSHHEPEAAETIPAPAPYVRASGGESNLLELQIAARRFVPARGKGPTVWLTGVSHIGTSNYFAALQRHLNAQTLVLFEGVGEHSQDFKNRKPEASSAVANNDANA